MKAFIGLALISAIFSVSATGHGSAKPTPSITEAYSYPIANSPGKKLTTLIVSYAPGQTTPPHTHGDSFVVGYVLEGSIRSKVDDEKERVFQVGESWTEKPGAQHLIGGNASKTSSAKILAVFVSDASQKDLVIFNK